MRFWSFLRRHWKDWQVLATVIALTIIWYAFALSMTAECFTDKADNANLMDRPRIQILVYCTKHRLLFPLFILDNNPIP